MAWYRRATNHYMGQCWPRFMSPYGVSRSQYIVTTLQWLSLIPLQWHHNGRRGVSNHQPHGCLLNCLFGHRWKKTSNLRVTGLCEGNSPVTGEFPAQRASNAENVSIWWRHHAMSSDSPGCPKHPTTCLLLLYQQFDLPPWCGDTWKNSSQTQVSVPPNCSGYYQHDCDWSPRQYVQVKKWFQVTHAKNFRQVVSAIATAVVKVLVWSWSVCNITINAGKIAGV